MPTELEVMAADRDAQVFAVTKLMEDNEKLRARITELNAAMVKLSNELPYPEELRTWTEQRGAMMAEIGTLKAELAEVKRRSASIEQERDALSQAHDEIHGKFRSRTEHARLNAKSANEAVLLANALMTELAELKVEHDKWKALALEAHINCGGSLSDEDRQFIVKYGTYIPDPNEEPHPYEQKCGVCGRVPFEHFEWNLFGESDHYFTVSGTEEPEPNYKYAGALPHDVRGWEPK